MEHDAGDERGRARQGSVPTARSSPSRRRSRRRSPSRPSRPAPGSCASSSRASRRTAATVRSPIRPGGPGDAIGVNALEKALDVVDVAAASSRSSGGSPRATRTSRRASSRSARTSSTPTPGCPSPRTSPTALPIEYVIWYPPQESAEEVAREIEEYVLAGCRLDTWLRDHPPTFEWLNNWPPMETPVGASTLVQTLARGHEAASGERVGPPSPRAPGQLRRRQRRLVLRGRGHPRRRLRAGRPQARALPGRARAARRGRDGGEGARGGGHRLVRDAAMTDDRCSHTPGHPGPPPGADSSAENRTGSARIVTIPAQLRDEIVAAVESRRDEAVALLQELVRLRSVNPNYPGIDRAEHLGGESRVNDLLEERYREAGLATHRVADGPRSRQPRRRPGGRRRRALADPQRPHRHRAACRGRVGRRQPRGARRSSTGASTGSARPT